MDDYHNPNYMKSIQIANERWLGKKVVPEKRKANKNVYKIEWNKSGKNKATTEEKSQETLF